MYSYWYSNNYMYLNSTIHILFDFENSSSFLFWEWILFIFVSYLESEYYSYLFQNYNLSQHYYYLQPRAMDEPQPSISFLRSLYLQNLKFYIFVQSMAISCMHQSIENIYSISVASYGHEGHRNVKKDKFRLRFLVGCTKS